MLVIKSSFSSFIAHIIHAMHILKIHFVMIYVTFHVITSLSSFYAHLLALSYTRFLPFRLFQAVEHLVIAWDADIQLRR